MSGFDYAVTNQLESFFSEAKKERFETLSEFAENHSTAVRFIGLPIGLCEVLMDIAVAVASLGESLIKGIVNIFGSPFCGSCEFLRGCMQLLEVPCGLVSLALGLPFRILVTIVYFSFYTAINPVECFEFAPRFM